MLPSTGAVRASPDVFLDSLSQHLASKPIYQHAVITGLKQAWEAKTTVNWAQGWEQLVSFFEQLLNDQHFWQQAEDTYQHWVVTAIADCLHAGTRNDEHAFDASLLPRTQCFGCGMLIVTTFSRYIEWKYWHGSSVTTDSLLRDAFQYPLLSGVLFGVVGWLTRGGNSAE
jgi:hypothetical protein